MRVIGRKVLGDFSRKHSQAGKNLDAWYKVIKDATWASLVEVRRVYPSADFVGGLTVFNISGNNYRLVVRINYKAQIVYINSVLTHAEYTKRKWKP
jgi:mRNA interferase HigB